MKPCELHIDASTVGLGAVLYQVIDGAKKVIVYASRSLSKSEERYPARKLEFLCGAFVKNSMSICGELQSFRMLTLYRAFHLRESTSRQYKPCGLCSICCNHGRLKFADDTEEETSPFLHILLTELRQAQNVDEILGMSKDVESWVHHCGRCLRFKGKPDRAPLVGIQTSEPLELVCTDFLKVDSAQNGTQYILVITYHFTRFAMALPIRNMSAKTTAEAILTFVRNFDIPKRLHANQGANFESKVIRALCQLLGVEKSRTTPFHPMGNGSCERINQTLISMLGTLPERKKKKDWSSYIGMLVLAYNSTKCDSTGFLPYFLMFGREPRLSVDNRFPLCSEPRGDYITSVKKALEWAWAKASWQTSERSNPDSRRQSFGSKLFLCGSS
ncbi:hypothetical protein RRG08_018522 [Elysia crispata]|uniref:Integrase catalytic domain-containing protein n=1 Tax=Elysia crispata TaxID=231223 RepID=A0AAE1CWX8_9GAST|nr:hypothetical protein RRG08_018522 [Elysia crispata]